MAILVHLGLEGVVSGEHEGWKLLEADLVREICSSTGDELN